MTDRQRSRTPSAWPAAFLALAAVSACNRPASQSAPAARSRFGGEYVGALAAADAFCEAWRRRDVAAAKTMLSLRVRRTFPDAHIADVIAGGPNPRHAAFEIGDGRRLEDGAFVFRLRLFLQYAGQAEDRIEGPLEEIVLRPDEAGRWRVDRFPLLADASPPAEVIRSQ